MFSEAPAKARISVFAMVPMASRPMFIPERNSSARVRFGFSSLSSLQDDAMDIATSITAPREAIRMPLTSSPLMCSFESPARSTSSSASDRLKPFNGEMVPARPAKIPAAATPPTQPSVAHSVLRLKPVSRRRDAAVVSATTPMETRIGSAPRRIRGTSRYHRQASV